MEPPKKKIKINDGASASAKSETAVSHETTVGMTDDNITAQGTTSRAEETAAVKHVACDKVLGTTELLEAILLGLDTKNLLLSQRVSKAFQATFTDSLAIQQALFLKPSATMANSWNHLAFTPGHPTYFRGASYASIVDVSTQPEWNNRPNTLKPGHGIHFSVSYWIDSDSVGLEKRNLALWPNLMRQPAVDVKVDLSCSMCRNSSLWTFKAGCTFGDLANYLENELECDCEPLPEGYDEDFDEDALDAYFEHTGNYPTMTMYYE